MRRVRSRDRTNETTSAVEWDGGRGGGLPSLVRPRSGSEGLRLSPHSQRPVALPCPMSSIAAHCTTGVEGVPQIDSGAMPSMEHPAHQRVLDAAHRKGVDLEITIFSESTHTAADAARAVGAEI